MTQVTDAYEWKGRTLIDSDGQKIGEIDEIYLDAETGEPEWATVTTGLFGTKTSFVPINLRLAKGGQCARRRDQGPDQGRAEDRSRRRAQHRGGARALRPLRA